MIRSDARVSSATTIRANVFQRYTGRVVLYLLVGFLAFLFAMPFVWMLSTAVKPGYQVYVMPPVWIPDYFDWSNFVRPWQNLPFHLFYRNTIVITVASIIGTLLSSSLVAFAFARMRFRGRNVLFVLVLSTIILPSQVTLIPQFLIFTWLGWINTLLPLIVPYWFGSPFNIFLIRQYMMTIPIEMDDAARIDGCGWLQLYWRIVMPMAAPALGVVAIFSFNFHWNDYLHPLIYLNETKNFTVALGLPLLNSRYVTDIQQTMAQTILAVIPVMLVFFFAQRYYIQGIVVTGVKG
ncbi:MAG TPA: carbohydrate ABC transporter permease [Chloroflexota bacterium]|jgi:multiple sugar transport system permease protein|nr:carbohydrate ABC transporter permease [Chloroflexota bacterium]